MRTILANEYASNSYKRIYYNSCKEKQACFSHTALDGPNYHRSFLTLCLQDMEYIVIVYLTEYFSYYSVMILIKQKEVSHE